jgi:hypothetical protein
MGGWLATHIPPLIDGSSLLTLFMLSGILRTVVAFSLVGTFKEIRPVSDIEDREMFYITMGIKPVLTLGEEIFYRKKKQPAIK